MLRVTVDLEPLGIKKFLTNLEELIIYNDGTGTQEVGNYVVKYGAWKIPIGGFERHKNSLELVQLAIEKLKEEHCLKSAGQSEEQITHSMKQ